MSEQRFGEAAAKFAESYRLDPATGTLLNLATCREAEGKLASAWLAFSDAMHAARREQREDRVQFAEARIASLEPRLSRLTIVVSPETRVPDLVVRLDGVVIGPAAYGVPTPIDPGPHRIEASASGKRAWQREIEIGRQADAQTVVLPVLEDAPLPVSPPPAVETAPAPIPRAASRSERPVPTVVYVSAGATALLAGAAAVTSIVYLAQREDVPPEEEASARRLGWVNAGFWAATLVGAGVTVSLYAARPERPQPAIGSLRARSWLTAGGGGLALSSEF